MVFRQSLLAVLATSSVAFGAAVEPKQQLLGGGVPSHRHNRTNVTYELEIAEIIPTVLNPFTPLGLMEVTWSAHATALLGNTIPPRFLQSPPIRVLLHQPDDDDTDSSDSDAAQTLKIGTSSPSGKDIEAQDANCDNVVIAFTDPDAPSRDNPEWSEMCHWVLYCHNDRVGEVVEYKPPGPPPWTGKHRYVAVAMVPANETSRPLHLTKPKDRQHWGYGKERMGMQKWADENGLKVIAANFIYSQDEIQGGW